MIFHEIIFISYSHLSKAPTRKTSVIFASSPYADAIHIKSYGYNIWCSSASAFERSPNILIRHLNESLYTYVLHILKYNGYMEAKEGRNTILALYCCINDEEGVKKE